MHSFYALRVEGRSSTLGRLQTQQRNVCRGTDTCSRIRKYNLQSKIEQDAFDWSWKCFSPEIHLSRNSLVIHPILVFTSPEENFRQIVVAVHGDETELSRLSVHRKCWRLKYCPSNADRNQNGSNSFNRLAYRSR